MIDAKKWRKLEKLDRHKYLTSRVKRDLKRQKELLQSKLNFIDRLLEKPTRRTTIDVG